MPPSHPRRSARARGTLTARSQTARSAASSAAVTAAALVESSQNAQIRALRANMRRQIRNAQNAKAEANRITENAERSKAEANRRTANAERAIREVNQRLAAAARQANRRAENVKKRANAKAKANLVSNLQDIIEILPKAGGQNYVRTVRALKEFVRLKKNERPEVLKGAARAVINNYMEIPNKIEIRNNATKQRLMNSLITHINNWSKLSVPNKKLIIGAIGSTVNLGIPAKIGIARNTFTILNRHSNKHREAMSNAAGNYFGGNGRLAPFARAAFGFFARPRRQRAAPRP